MAQPSLRRYANDSATGRGLRLIESMSSTWGVEAIKRGKIIWFQLDLSQRGAAQAWDDGADVDLEALLGGYDFDDGGSDAPHASVKERRLASNTAPPQAHAA